jgi:beta-glucosidase-like glycosyl hydrolase
VVLHVSPSPSSSPAVGCKIPAKSCLLFYVVTCRSSYNRVNGTHVSESKDLLDDVLRKEWGWEGMIMSDWTGVYSSEASVKAGLDLEMP